MTRSKLRVVFCGEEQLNSRDDLNEILHYFFDPIAGMKAMQTEFSVSNLSTVRGEDLWHCNVFLEARGIDDEGHVRVYTNESFAVLSLPPVGHVMPASLRAWEFRSEGIRQSKKPIGFDLIKSLAAEGAKASLDIADFDNDDDQDIAITVSSGNSLVRGLFVFEDGEYSNQWSQLSIDQSVSETFGSNSRTAWVDIDRNGYTDLVFGDRVFENQDGEKFEDVTERFFENLSEESTSLGTIRRKRSPLIHASP